MRRNRRGGESRDKYGEIGKEVGGEAIGRRTERWSATERGVGEDARKKRRY